jgi:nanoRNase/pAp phosphatase (c-di-AMP/oligoRNAs hydrolase)
MWEYLQAAGITIEPRLATALVYGIRSDTQDLGRETTRADIEAFLALYPMANPRALGRIVAAPLPRTYFARLRWVLDSAVIHGHSIVASVSPLDTPEMLAEAADLLLRVAGVSWVLCYGVIDDWLYVSLRTSDREPAAGTIARRLAGKRGYGGGHQALAGAQIPLPPSHRAEPGRSRFIRGIIRRFLKATGSAGEPAEPLCEPVQG